MRQDFERPSRNLAIGMGDRGHYPTRPDSNLVGEAANTTRQCSAGQVNTGDKRLQDSESPVSEPHIASQVSHSGQKVSHYELDHHGRRFWDHSVCGEDEYRTSLEVPRQRLAGIQERKHEQDVEFLQVSGTC